MNTYVTQPFLPPLEEFFPYLEKIWDSKWLTNNGQFHQQFERELAEYLGVKYLSLFSNGTLALISALQSLRITGEVITTPFSFVATTHSLWWNGIKPVFCDIEPNTYNINPDKLESLITPKTTAIMPVHVYGYPCDLNRIKEIAEIYGLKVIYDACHTFGVDFEGESILNYGDLSVLSFHATKVFNTFEGGAIVCHDEATKKRIDYLKNFGFADEVTVIAPGINAKMNEFQAAIGVLQLKHIDNVIVSRQEIAENYYYSLEGLEGITLPKKIKGLRHTYPYFPILIDKEKYGRSRDKVYDLLKEHDIYARKYFYPLISQFPTYRELESSKQSNLPIASRIAEEVLCLPIYPSLEKSIVEHIINLLKRT